MASRSPASVGAGGRPRATCRTSLAGCVKAHQLKHHPEQVDGPQASARSHKAPMVIICVRLRCNLCPVSRVDPKFVTISLAATNLHIGMLWTLSSTLSVKTAGAAALAMLNSGFSERHGCTMNDTPAKDLLWLLFSKSWRKPCALIRSGSDPRSALGAFRKTCSGPRGLAIPLLPLCNIPKVAKAFGL